MEFLLLGPFEVRDSGRALDLGGVRQRALLAYLALHPNEPVAVDRLIDELWGDAPPATATKAVHNAVARLRKVVGDRLMTRAPGYLLHVEPGELDTERFEQLVAEARGRASHESAAGLRDALELWRGRPLADLAYEPFAAPAIARLEELRLAALEDRIDADLALGHHRELVGELEALVHEHPLRERLRAQQMLALYRSGRQADALEAYGRTRRRLVDELGLEPGPALQQLEQAILRQDSGLELPVATHASHRRRRGLVAVVVLAVGAGVGVVADLTATGGRTVVVAPDSVAVIDARSGSLVASIPVGARPTYVAAGAGAIWTANAGDSTISRIDPSTLRTIRTIPVVEPPTGLATGAGSVWVSAASGTVRRIDPGFDAVVQTLRASRYGFEYDSSLNALSPVAYGEGSIWFGNSSTVTRIDPRAGASVGSVGVGFSPSGIAVGDGSVWVADSVDDTVTRIPSNGSTASIPVGHGASAVVIGGGAVWVADTRDDAVVRIDPKTDAVTTTVHVGRAPTGIAFGGGAVWVASGNGAVTRIDATSGRVTKRVTVGGSPAGLAIADGRIWVSVQERAPAASALSGGVARFAAPAEPDSLDPALGGDAAAQQLEYATCVKLLNYPDAPAPAGSRLEREAAAFPAIADGGRAYTFLVRPRFRFSPPSNQLVTAETFQRSIVRAMKLNPDAAALLAAVSSVRARGQTLTLRLSRPEPSLPARLASPFFCAVPTDTPLAPQRTEPIPSAGPYFIASYLPKQRLVLRRNPNYRGSRPRRFDEIDYSFGQDPARTVAAIEAGRTDYAVSSFITGAVPTSAIPSLTARLGPQAGTHQRFFVNPTLEEVWLSLNPNRPVFSRESTRRAVAFAIDRPALARDAAYAFEPDSYLVPPAVGSRPAGQIYPLRGPDLRVARRLEAGRTGTVVMYTCDGCSEQLVQAELARIGLDVLVRAYPVAQMLQRVKTAGTPVDLYFGGTIAAYADPAAFLNDVLIGKYVAALAPHDPDVLRALRAAAGQSGPARGNAYRRLDVELARRAYLVPLGYGTSFDLFSTRIGCELYQPIYGMDIGALCLRPRR